ncbi:hypothetical protein BDA96_03G237300 [Sorghum bicolor]|uniref:Uncharacterized protein n=2 Tax=Sorghum bicolor TaxID=4558 RepID=A0A921UN94_SORBI|nr:uncharacterized protein LOC8084822 [Sorghum bicolor]KAG0538452.1 hypothetical protein BDA96_03G237300 [Sorghum bicolor]OQU87164.1 hypothetical protein SORBI_3003G219100 [Sorghum bicolor]|eukprot:XP_002455949.1 uncharacterized protein LOC8084822 [Sorghum bicolor]
MASAAAFPSSLFLFPTRPSTPPLPSSSSRPSHSHSRPHLRIRSPPIPNYPAALPASSRMEVAQGGAEEPAMKLLFVEMGVGYDQHGQDITAAAVRACKDAITSNSIPAFRGGSIPGVNTDQMKLQIKLGVPRSTQHLLDAERVKAVFPYGKIISFEVVDGGMICSSGVCLEAMGDKNDDCYIVNAAVYVGY